MLEIEHQAEHWDTPEHGEIGHLIAEALRAAVEIARGGGLKCQHRAEEDALASQLMGPTQARVREAVQPPIRPATTRA